MIQEDSNKKYNVLLIGLGQIGFYYDWDGGQFKDSIQTHARAFFLHENFNLIAAVDPDKQARKDFSDAYDLLSYASIEDVSLEISYDLVVVATSTMHHLNVIRYVADNIKPMSILCEKPVGCQQSDVDEIEFICELNDIDLYVNYIRRVDPAVVEIKELIDLDSIEQKISGVVWYSKGFVHNGSHFVDLLIYLLGDVVSSQLMMLYQRVANGDFLADINVIFANGVVTFKPLLHKQLDYNAMELFSCNGWLEYKNGGRNVIWQPYSPQSSTTGYRILSGEKRVLNSDLENYQWNIAVALYDELSGKRTSLCRLNEAKKIHNIVNGLVIENE